MPSSLVSCMCVLPLNLAGDLELTLLPDVALDVQFITDWRSTTNTEQCVACIWAGNGGQGQG